MTAVSKVAWYVCADGGVVPRQSNGLIAATYREVVEENPQEFE